MIAAGWEVGAHTLTHPDLTTVDDAALEAEVAGSRKLLRKRLGVPITAFCYPAGRNDARVRAAVKTPGFTTATTDEPGIAGSKDDPFALPRIRVTAPTARRPCSSTCGPGQARPDRAGPSQPRPSPASSSTACAALRPFSAITLPGRMRRGAAEVDAVDRRARRQPVLPHLVGRDLALEDVAAGQADALLDVRRAEHLVVDEDVAEAGRERVDQRDELLRDLVAARVPVALREVVRRVLAEDAQQVVALGRGRRVVAGLDVDLAEADGGLAARAGVGGVLRGLEPVRQVDRRLRRASARPARRSTPAARSARR